MSNYYNKYYSRPHRQYNNYRNQHRNRYDEHYNDYEYYDNRQRFEEQQRQNQYNYHSNVDRQNQYYNNNNHKKIQWKPYDNKKYNNNNNNKYQNYDYNGYYYDDDNDKYYENNTRHNEYDQYQHPIHQGNKPLPYGQNIDYKSRDKTTNIRDNTAKHSTRYNHFLSIRLNNPYIIKLGTQLQQDIMNQYKKHNISISSSLVQPIKFHISMNVMALPTQKDVEKFVKIFKLVRKWLKTFVFDKSDAQKVLIGDDGMFQEAMEKYGFLKKFKVIYQGIEKGNINGIKGYPLYLEGINHFNQNVVFLDFKNKCVMGMDNIKLKMKRRNRNDLVLKLVETFYELIVCLCKVYDIGVDDSVFIPHCTFMKLSKLRGIEMKKFMKYNKINEIKLLKSDSNLGDNKKNKKRRYNKVYDWHVLIKSLNNQNVDKKIKLMREDNDSLEVYEDVMKIDFCAMMGSHLTDDGYYNVIQSLSIVP
eukprot:246908_1